MKARWNKISILWHSDLLFLTLIFIVGLLLRLVSMGKLTNFVPTGDGISYCLLAQNIFNDKGLRDVILFYFPPVYPLVTGFAYFLLNDISQAGQIVSIISSSLLVIPTFFLAAELVGGRRAARIATLLVATNILLIENSLQTLSESTYALLLLVALYFGMRAMKTRSITLILCYGLLFCLAFLTRGEALINFTCTTVYLFVIFGFGRGGMTFKPAWLLALAVLIFFIFTAPYFIFLQQKSGKWLMSGKISTNISRSAAIYSTSDYYKGVKASFRENYFVNQDGELGLFRAPKHNLVKYFISYPGRTIKVFLSNVKEEVQRLPLSGWLLILFAICGALISTRQNRTWGLKWLGLFLLQFSSAVLTLMLITLHPVGLPYGRFWVVYMPIIFIYIAIAVDYVFFEVKFFDRWRIGVINSTLIFVVLLFIWMASQITIINNHLGLYNKQYEPIIKWYAMVERIKSEIKIIIPEQARVMSFDLSFFLNASFSAAYFPLDNFDNLLRYARHNKVRYIFTNIGDNLINEGLGFEREPPEKVEKNLLLIKQWHDQFFLFKVLPENQISARPPPLRQPARLNNREDAIMK